MACRSCFLGMLGLGLSDVRRRGRDLVRRVAGLDRRGHASVEIARQRGSPRRRKLSRPPPSGSDDRPGGSQYSAPVPRWTPLTDARAVVV